MGRGGEGGRVNTNSYKMEMMSVIVMMILKSMIVTIKARNAKTRSSHMKIGNYNFCCCCLFVFLCFFSVKLFLKMGQGH